MERIIFQIFKKKSIQVFRSKMEELMIDVENLSKTNHWEIEPLTEGNEKLMESIKEARNFIEMLKIKMRGANSGDINEIRNYINKLNNPNIKLPYDF